jgi:hypothetical protein
MKKYFPLFFIAMMLGALWSYALFYVPTFDLDESLYRRVAEEMKSLHAWWAPTWDTWPLNHKPPFFYWLIIFFSNRLGQDDATHVGVLAARMPSVFANIGILVTLFFSHDFIFGKNFGNELRVREDLDERWAAPLLYLAGLFPLLTGTAVIFDPLQTLLLLPSLLIPTRYFICEQWKSGERLPFGTLFFWSLSLFLATYLKGLNGIIIPSFAFGLQLLLLGWNSRKETGSLKRVVREGLRFFTWVFIPAALLCGAGFYYLDLKMGHDFTREFFLVHHLGRSEEAMETHGGSIFYHPLVLFLGGGFLSSFLIFQLLEWWNRFRKVGAAPAYVQYGFPLTFVFAFIFAFSFVATKLPHYTWPIWPAVAVAGMIHLHLVRAKKIEAELSRGQRFVASLPVTLLGVFFLAGALNLPSLFAQNASLVADSPSARAVLEEFPGFHGFAQLLLTLGALICFAFQRYRQEMVRRPILLAFAGLSTALAISLSVMPVATALLVTPINQIGHDLQQNYLVGGECIRYAAPHSPTLSLALGFIAVHNRCEPSDAAFLIVPAWKFAECQDLNLEVIEKSGYFYLCGKSPMRKRK